MLLWYFDTLSQISTVYGSLTTAIAVLLSLEVAATLLLLGAQVIAEYERLGRRRCAAAAAALPHAAALNAASGREQPGLARRIEQQRGQRRQLLADVGRRRGAGARAPHQRPLATSVNDAVAP